MSDEALKKITSFMKEMNSKYQKKYGSDILYFGDLLGDFKPFETGFPTFDHINSGIGGFPRGGMTLVHGLESCGKSTFVLEAARYQIKINPDTYILYIDVENSLTESFLRYKEFDPQKLVICPLPSEDAFDVAETAIKENVYDMIVIDSLAKVESEKTLDKDINESKQMSTRASLISEFLKRISLCLRRSKTALVCINQETQNMKKKTPYDPDTILPCGNQQKFTANLRIQLKRGITLKNGAGEKIGYVTNMTSAKNKIANRENAKTSLNYLYGRGFIRAQSLVDYLLIIGYIEKQARGYYEFKKKEIHPDKFRAEDMPKVADSILRNLGIDLYSLKSDEMIEFEKASDETDVEAVEE